MCQGVVGEPEAGGRLSDASRRGRREKRPHGDVVVGAQGLQVEAAEGVGAGGHQEATDALGEKKTKMKLCVVTIAPLSSIVLFRGGGRTKNSNCSAVSFQLSFSFSFLTSLVLSVMMVKKLLSSSGWLSFPCETAPFRQEAPGAPSSYDWDSPNSNSREDRIRLHILLAEFADQHASK